MNYKVFTLLIIAFLTSCSNELIITQSEIIEKNIAITNTTFQESTVQAYKAEPIPFDCINKPDQTCITTKTIQSKDQQKCNSIFNINISNKETAWTECIISFAAATNQPGICSLLDGNKDYCIMSIAKIRQSKEICNKLENKYQEFKCKDQIKVIEKCDDLLSNEKRTCIINNAKKAKDITICNELDSLDPFTKWRSCYPEIAAITKNSSICKLIPNVLANELESSSAELDGLTDCITYMAIINKHPDKCKDLLTEFNYLNENKKSKATDYALNQCITRTAAELQDKGFCELLTNKEYKTRCSSLEKTENSFFFFGELLA